MKESVEAAFNQKSEAYHQTQKDLNSLTAEILKTKILGIKACLKGNNNNNITSHHTARLAQEPTVNESTQIR